MAAAGERARVLIAGGGVAGIEAAMAMADLAGRQAEVKLIAPEREFMLKALTVKQPFTLDGPTRYEIRPILAKLGAEHIRGTVAAVEPDRHEIKLDDGAILGYDALVVCVGGRPRVRYEGAETFWPGIRMAAVDALVDRAYSAVDKTLAVVVPPAVRWALPAYELALLMRRRADDLGHRDLVIELFTPESAPLAAFGEGGSAAVAKLLQARRIRLRTSTAVTEDPASGLVASGESLVAGAVIALPEIDGPRIAGLPSDERGFIPVDEHCLVEGLADVYAAGDGTSSPIKQGGLAAQQADAAAEHLAASLGADVDPKPFDPVLRGELLTGSDSLKMLHRLADEDDPGEVSPDFLWWPRKKVAGRYLSAWLAGRSPSATLDPRDFPLEVEVAFEEEWHGEPLIGPDPMGSGPGRRRSAVSACDGGGLRRPRRARAR